MAAAVLRPNHGLNRSPPSRRLQLYIAFVCLAAEWSSRSAGEVLNSINLATQWLSLLSGGSQSSRRRTTFPFPTFIAGTLSSTSCWRTVSAASMPRISFRFISEPDGSRSLQPRSATLRLMARLRATRLPGSPARPVLSSFSAFTDLRAQQLAITSALTPARDRTNHDMGELFDLINRRCSGITAAQHRTSRLFRVCFNCAIAFMLYLT